MEFAPTVAMVALIIKLIDFTRYAKSRDLNGVITQLCAWGAGVAVAVFVARTDWAPSIVMGGKPLSQLNSWSLVFAGLFAGSTASVGKDVLYKSLDNHTTSAIAPLLRSGSKKIDQTGTTHVKDPG